MRRKLFDLSLALALCVLILARCGMPPLYPTALPTPGPASGSTDAASPEPGPLPTSTEEGKMDVTDKPIASTPQPEHTAALPAGAFDQGRLIAGNTAFAFDLYRHLARGSQGNLFYSPYSLSQALAMTYAGARGETEQQMAQALHFPVPQEGLHPAFGSLDQELSRRGQSGQGKDGQGFRLNVVNALWGQDGYSFLDSFTSLLAADYGAALRLVDFMDAAEEARATINRWASEKTEGRIQDLIPPGVLNAMTRLVLTNAIYFNAAWATPFNPDMTKDGPFYRLDGTQVSVPTMRQTESLGYFRADGVQVVELPYDGRQIAMTLLLPEPGQFEAFEATLNAGRVDSLLKGLSPQQVALAMPRFRFDAQFSLKQTLSEMGMPLAFSPDADFSGMTGKVELFINEVLHKAFVSVDEAGTEAAAATAVVVGLTSMPAQPVEVTVDHPFLFLIRDLPTGTILFVGRVVDPGP